MAPRALLVGIFQYGALADAMGHQFESRWLRAPADVTADALSVQDFSPTTDLYSNVANVQGMRLLPISTQQLIPLVIAGLLPFVPVILVALPVKAVLGYVAKLVL